ncbi:unnamed protein product [Periconia digitata]|uniref:Uncharacterized protein n=1 Tax=Periconia digitata TaxID=1303443 RepID=A0A9W4UT34_9PLEO|nr:unnamed protein product [Periconia digitata]
MSEKRKRRSASSPSPLGTARKRARDDSSTGSNKPVAKDGLATSRDWKFRIKVLSTQGFDDDDVVAEAVQGLIDLCFPESVLNELGVDVVTQHMMQQSAPASQIDKMRCTFQSSMVDKVACMLATYLDDNSKYESALSVLVNRIQELHGYSPRHMSATAEPGDLMALSESNVTTVATVEHSGDLTRSNESNEQSYERQGNYPTGHLNPQTESDSTVSTLTVERPNSSIATAPDTSNAQPIRVTKVSKSWRWDVDPNDITVDTIPDHFQKIGDLFAYHALPVVNLELGQEATRKDKLKAMNSRLAAMSRQERKEWDESFQELRNGDLTILRRSSATIPREDQNYRTTPAPATLHKRRKRDNFESKVRSDSNQNSGTSGEEESVLVAGQEHRKVKAESIPDDEPSHARMEIIRHDHGEAIRNNSDSNFLTSHSASTPHSKTPLVDLLWGDLDLSHRKAADKASMMLKEINKRITVNAIEFREFNGHMRYISKLELASDLCGVFSSISDMPVRLRIEECVLSWAVAYPRCFPEIRDAPFLFIHHMPNVTDVMDLVWQAHRDILSRLTSDILPEVCASLERRGIPQDILCGRPLQSFQSRLKYVLANSSMYIVEQRAHIEQALREIAFKHKGKFPELSSTVLTKTWERNTGCKWS